MECPVVEIDDVKYVERRRRWTEKEKIRMVEDSNHRPVSEVARENGIAPRLLFGWRREFGAPYRRTTGIHKVHESLHNYAADLEKVVNTQRSHIESLIDIIMKTVSVSNTHYSAVSKCRAHSNYVAVIGYGTTYEEAKEAFKKELIAHLG